MQRNLCKYVDMIQVPHIKNKSKHAYIRLNSGLDLDIRDILLTFEKFIDTNVKV